MAKVSEKRAPYFFLVIIQNLPTQVSANLKQISTKKEFRLSFSTTAVQISNNSKLIKLRVLSRLFMTYLTQQLIVHIIQRRNSRCIVSVVAIYGEFSPCFTDKPRHNTLPDTVSACFVDRVPGTFNSR
jgi:hypothetical protein